MVGRQSLNGFQQLVLGAKWFSFSLPVFLIILTKNINDFSSGHNYSYGSYVVGAKTARVWAFPPKKLFAFHSFLLSLRWNFTTDRRTLHHGTLFAEWKEL
jgi:hypothetical protein